MCSYCLKDFKREQARLSHIRQTLYCRRADNEARSDRPTPATENPHGLDDFNTLEDDPPNSDDADPAANDDLDALMDFFERMPTPPCQNGPLPPHPAQPSLPKSPARSRTVTKDTNVDVFRGAGKVFRKENTIFERWPSKHGHKSNPYHPFKSKHDWEIARWAKQEGPGASAIDRLLKCPSVSVRRLVAVLLLIPLACLRLPNV